MGSDISGGVQSSLDSPPQLTAQAAMMMATPPRMETTDRIRAFRPRRAAPSTSPCWRLFLDWRETQEVGVDNWPGEPSGRSVHYHNGEGQRYDVDWPHWAEAGQDGQKQEVSGFGPVRGRGLPFRADWSRAITWHREEEPIRSRQGSRPLTSAGA